MRRKQIRVAILSNEFFDASLGRSGGFGWAAREAARCLRRRIGGQVSIEFLHGEPPASLSRHFASVHCDGFTIRSAIRSRSSRLGAMVRPAPDLILAIDYRPSFAHTIAYYDNAPTIVWASDPRTPEDWRRVQSLRLPGSTESPIGVSPIDCLGLSTLSMQRPRPVVLGAKMPHIVGKCEATYGLTSAGLLPNPDSESSFSRTAAVDREPLVVFLGRLDPIKRPWLVVAGALRLPEVRFVLAGKLQVGSGPGVWTPADLATNVSLIGEVNEQEKQRLLQRAWLLINTSIYEETPVSWLEALMYAVPIVATVDCGNIARRFGRFAGDHLGDGMEAVPQLVDAVRELLEPNTRRVAGEAGAEFVCREHNDGAFLRALAELSALAGESRVSEVLNSVVVEAA